MSVSAAKMLVYAGNDLACVKISGRANFTSSVDFKAVIEQLQKRGQKRIVVDLTDCLLMDSTFLGVLTGFGLQASRSGNGGGDTQVLQLLNPNPRISELLDNLGVIHLFKICVGGSPIRETTTTSTPAAGNVSHEEMTRACLEAHQQLIAANPENAARFKEVTQFLAEDLKKSKGGS